MKTQVRCLKFKSTRLPRPFSIWVLVLLQHINLLLCNVKLLLPILFLERHGWGSQSRLQFSPVHTMSLDSFRRVFFLSFQSKISDLRMVKMVLDPIATKPITILSQSSDSSKEKMPLLITRVKLNNMLTYTPRDLWLKLIFLIEWLITYQSTPNLPQNSKSKEWAKIKMTSFGNSVKSMV